MENKFAFTCTHCGKEIFVSQSGKEVTPPDVIQQPSPDEIPTTAVEVVDIEIPLKDVILEPDPIDEILSIEEIEPEPLDEYDDMQEVSPEEIEEYIPERPAKRSRPTRPERPSRTAGRGGRTRPDRESRAPKRKAPAGNDFDVVLDPVPEDLEDVAIDMIMDIANVPEREALKILDGKFIVPVKGVSKTEAEDVLADFEAEGITGSIKRKRPRR